MINNENAYFEILMKNHDNLADDIVNTYFNKHKNEEIITYFRLFFLYYLLTTYVYKPELNINQIKNIFFKWITSTLTNKKKKYILNIFYHQFNYLFKIFFVDKNIYFHVYFNNLIKYFLPLPFELNIFSPIITYRANVNSFYKKNNDDYFSQPNNFDTCKKHLSNFNSDEIDIHIPMTFFNEKFIRT